MADGESGKKISTSRARFPGSRRGGRRFAEALFCVGLAVLAATFAWRQKPPLPLAPDAPATERALHWLSVAIEQGVFPALPRVETNLRAMVFASDARRGWAVGDSGTILSTADGGATWIEVSLRRWWPAPWLYLSWLLLLLIAALRLRNRPNDEEDSIGIEAVADQPTKTLASDRLAFKPLVIGLARLVRSESTKLPLVVAINGDWGSGKSSIMRMLASELDRHGVRSSWFNAWHHQEDRLLAVPFLQSVCSDSVPPIVSLAGALFRLRLAWRRASHSPFLAFLIVVLIGQAGVPWLPSIEGSTASTSLLGTPVKAAKEAGETALDLLKADNFLEPLKKFVYEPRHLSLLLALVGVLLLLNSLRAFPESPANLLGSAGDRLKLAEVFRQSVFRRRFAAHFADVAWALRPQPICVFVDDLDRCSPEKAVQVLEVTNFLVNCGDCLVVLGIAKERVERLVGLANQDLAKEMLSSGEALAEAIKPEVERRLRRDYARQYLDKLIQLEIPVPGTDLAGLSRMVAKPDEDGPPHDSIARMFSQLRRLKSAFSKVARPVAALGVLLAAALVLVSHAPESERPLAVRVAAEGSVPTQPPEVAAPIFLPEPTAQSSPVETTGVITLPPEPSRPRWPWVAGATTFLLVLVWYGLERRRAFVVKDSREYKAAVSRWLGAAFAINPSPRQARRFGNFTRYAAMMLRSDEELSRIDQAETAVRHFARRVLRRLGKVPAAETLTGVSDPELWERSVVALASIQFARPDLITRGFVLSDRWKDQLIRLEKFETGHLGQRGAKATNAERAEVDALRAIQNALDGESLGIPWPPGDEVLVPFRRYLLAATGSGEIERRDEVGADERGPSLAGFREEHSANAQARGGETL